MIDHSDFHLKRFSVKLYRITLVERSFHKGEEIVSPTWYDHSTWVERYRYNWKSINISRIHALSYSVFQLFTHRVVFPWKENGNQYLLHPTAKVNFSNVINDFIHHDYYIFFYSLIFKSLRWWYMSVDSVKTFWNEYLSVSLLICSKQISRRYQQVVNILIYWFIIR